MRFAKNEFYHIYNRGVEGRDIFVDKSDYDRFLRCMVAFNHDSPIEMRTLTEIVSPEKNEMMVSCVAYALMRNHVHMVLRCNDEFKMSRYIQKLFIGYTMYFNAKYNRKGVLFQGRSKSKHIDNDRYLMHIIDYVHLNPLDYVSTEWRGQGVTNIKNAQSALINYTYSSLPEMLHMKQDFVLDHDLIREFLFDINPLKSALSWSYGDTISGYYD